MHAQLDAGSRQETPLLDFARRGREALATATALPRGLKTGKPEKAGEGRWRVPVTVRTRVFGTVRGQVLIDVDTAGDKPHIVWARRLVFPGLRDDEQLSRSTKMPVRGSLLARDRSVLAEGEGRTSAQPDVAAQVVGQLGPVPEERADELSALGVPEDASVGLTGLERIFDERLAGLPSGRCWPETGRWPAPPGAPGRRAHDARPRARARRDERAGRPLRRRRGARPAQRRGARVLGRAVLDPPAAGIDVQDRHDGRGAGEQGRQAERHVRPRVVRAALRGQARERRRRGLRRHARAGVRGILQLGLRPDRREARRTAARRLRRAARVQPAGAFPVVAESTIPDADKVGDDLAVGASAIGQGLVQATTLEMAEIAATVARRGLRPKSTLDLEASRRPSAKTGPRR